MKVRLTEQAVLLHQGEASEEAVCAAKMLNFFGVSLKSARALKIPLEGAANDGGTSKIRLLCSAEALLGLGDDSKRNVERMQPWSAAIHSIFVYPGEDRDAFQAIVRIATADEHATIQWQKAANAEFTISDQLNDFCGVMGGLSIGASSRDSYGCVEFNTTAINAIPIIRCVSGTVFLKASYHGVPIFISACRKIIDIDTELTSQNFDVRRNLHRAVPLALYIKWAFPTTSWDAPEANACLVIDDPVLKRRYGCVDFKQLHALMESHRFSTNIALIPWNWRRSRPETVELFKHANGFSLSVHGCDHTRAEFGTSDRDKLHAKAKRALERMNNHQSDTGLSHNRVMVFPQGVFSETGMDVLKHTDFIASVNNDVVPPGKHSARITIREIWDTAVMRYSAFPIFTRRYPWEGVANFAFDILLGKPAIIVVHHDYCGDGCRRLVRFIEELNQLRCPLVWRDLAGVVRHSCRRRNMTESLTEIQMYGKELHVENSLPRRHRYAVRLRDFDLSMIEEIRLGSRQVAGKVVNGRVTVEFDLEPGEETVVGIKFRAVNGNGARSDSFSYRAAVMARRYLCEIRDNFVTPARLRLAAFS